MAWADTLLKGSFRGASFEIEEHSHSGGRRGALHEYPLRDTPYFEDLGRKTREFTVDCFIIGDNYQSARNSLIAACETSGAGTLIHPYLGTKQVVCTSFSVNERIDEGRMCRIIMTLIEAGTNQFPSGVTDIAFKVTGLAGLASASNVADFLRSYSSEGLPGFVFDSTQSAAGSFSSILSGLTSDVDFVSSVDDFVRNIGSLVRAPGEFASSVVGLIGTLRSTLQPRSRNSKTAKAAIAAMKNLTGFNVDAEASRINQTTPARIAQVQNMEAFATLVRREALANESISIPSVTLDSYQAAIAYARDYVGRIDDELLRDDAENSYTTLTNLAAVVSSALTTQAGALPQLTTKTLADTTPTLALSYELYADPTKADDITARNSIRHPSFVPANVALEVLAR